MRLLYVDDDRINTLLFTETCKLTPGLEVAAAETGAEAVEVAARFHPDVLVIDLHLPDTDGYALLPRLRSVAGLATTPAFLCTAEIPQAVEGPAARAGFDGCWSKPVQLSDLLAQIGRLRSAS